MADWTTEGSGFNSWHGQRFSIYSIQNCCGGQPVTCQMGPGRPFSRGLNQLELYHLCEIFNCRWHYLFAFTTPTKFLTSPDIHAMCWAYLFASINGWLWFYHMVIVCHATEIHCILYYQVLLLLYYIILYYIILYYIIFSATSWSLVQRSPTDCGVSLCVI